MRFDKTGAGQFSGECRQARGDCVARVAVPQTHEACEPLVLDLLLNARIGNLGVKCKIAALVELVHCARLAKCLREVRAGFRRPTRFIKKPHELLSRNGSPILAAHIGRQSESGFDCSKLGSLELRLSDVPPSRKRQERKCFRDLA